MRARAFAGGQAVGAISESVFCQLLPRPPKPQVFLGDVTPTRSVLGMTGCVCSPDTPPDGSKGSRDT